jgi:hypothetical protein
VEELLELVSLRVAQLSLPRSATDTISFLAGTCPTLRLEVSSSTFETDESAAR